jgi:hypoxanthine phosphoribosyltransferase
VEIEPQHVAFEIPDEFVVGYGLDYRDEFRNLPYVAALEAVELSAGPES